jgi:hypothetical protein
MERQASPHRVVERARSPGAPNGVAAQQTTQQ